MVMIHQLGISSDPNKKYEEILMGKTKNDETFIQTKFSNHIEEYRGEIIWRNVLALSLLHILAIYYYLNNALSPMIKWYYLFIPDFFGRLSGLGILAGAHRLWAHRSYKACLSLRVALMLMQTMALQNDIYDWCRDHRVHHKHSDTHADPYNVRRGFFFSHIGWLMVKKHPEVIRKGKAIDLSDLWADPVVRFQRRFYIPLVILLWGMLPTYLTHLITGFPWIECFFGAVVFRYVYSLHCTWTVNSLAHMYGYQTYDQTFEPRENRFVTYLSWGEGYHNYHHVFPWDYSASELGWTRCFNMATIFIDLCAWFGLAYDLKKVKPYLIHKRIMRTGDQAKYLVQQTSSSLVLDYIFGFFVSQHLLLITMTLRILVNGSF